MALYLCDDAFKRNKLDAIPALSNISFQVCAFAEIMAPLDFFKYKSSMIAEITAPLDFFKYKSSMIAEITVPLDFFKYKSSMIAEITATLDFFKYKSSMIAEMTAIFNFLKTYLLVDTAILTKSIIIINKLMFYHLKTR